jgi:hypothetical protein
VPGVYARYRKHQNNVTNQRERCIDEASRCFEIIGSRYPQYKRDALIGEANVILYGRGISCLIAGDSSGATRLFLDGIKRHPLGWKLWVRLAQAIIRHAGESLAAILKWLTHRLL